MATAGSMSPAAVNDVEMAHRSRVKASLEKFLSTPEPVRPEPGPISLDQTAPQAAPVSASPAHSASP